jgi:hypothetical protein
MSSQPPSVAAAAMPVVATASASASTSASASSTSPQLPSPSASSSSPHSSSSSSDTVTCAPSAGSPSPSPGTASAHDSHSHHRATVLERLVLNGKSLIFYAMHAHARTGKKSFACLTESLCSIPLSTCTRPIPQRQKRQQSETLPVAAQRPAFHTSDPDAQSCFCVISRRAPLTRCLLALAFFQPPFVANSLYRRLAPCVVAIQAPRLPRHASAGT